MLTRKAEEKALFREVSALVESLGLSLVEVSQDREKGCTNMRVVLSKKEGDINTEDLEKAYNVIYPMYQVICENRDLNLEVSSPGMQRSFKDYYEFSVFCGRNVRVYSTLHSSYVVGRIGESNENSVVLYDYTIEDKKEKGESITMDYDTIAKAKLECIWEEKK